MRGQCSNSKASWYREGEVQVGESGDGAEKSARREVEEVMVWTGEQTAFG